LLVTLSVANTDAKRGFERSEMRRPCRRHVPHGMPRVPVRAA